MDAVSHASASGAGHSLPPAVPDRGATTRLEPVHRTHPQRTSFEFFIAARFHRAYGARVAHFSPHLLGVRDALARWQASSGYTPADGHPLFLEQYLDQPIEDSLAGRVGRPVAREAVVEVGNLAAVSPGVGAHPHPAPRSTSASARVRVGGLHRHPRAAQLVPAARAESAPAGARRPGTAARRRRELGQLLPARPARDGRQDRPRAARRGACMSGRPSSFGREPSSEPQPPALEGAHEALSAAALAERVERLAGALCRALPRPRMLGVLADNGPDWVVVDRAAERIGLPLVPLPRVLHGRAIAARCGRDRHGRALLRGDGCGARARLPAGRHARRRERAVRYGAPVSWSRCPPERRRSLSRRARPGRRRASASAPPNSGPSPTRSWRRRGASGSSGICRSSRCRCCSRTSPVRTRRCSRAPRAACHRSPKWVSVARPRSTPGPASRRSTAGRRTA